MFVSCYWQTSHRAFAHGVNAGLLFSFFSVNGSFGQCEDKYSQSVSES